MALVLKTAPVDPPVSDSDWTRTQELITMLFLGNNGPILRVVGGNIVKGSVFQIGGAIYYADSDTAISGVESDYVKITPAGATASASYVADLSGVSWNDEYNGYVDVSGNLYVFDEAKEAYRESIIPRTLVGKSGFDIRKYIAGVFSISSCNTTAGYIDDLTSICFSEYLKTFFAAPGATKSRVIRSKDAYKWEPSQATAARSSKIISGNNLLVVVRYGGTNRISTSEDGISWASGSSVPVTNEWTSVAYGYVFGTTHRYVAVARTGTGDRIIVSEDALTWSLHLYQPEDRDWQSIAYGGNTFIAVANSGDGYRIIAGDGFTSWSAKGSTIDLNAIAALGPESDGFVAVGNGQKITVTNNKGSSWTEYDLGADFNYNWVDVTYGGGLWMAVSSTGEIMVSKIYSKWRLLTSPIKGSWTSVAYGNDMFVICGIDDGGVAVIMRCLAPII